MQRIGTNFSHKIQREINVISANLPPLIQRALRLTLLSKKIQFLRFNAVTMGVPIEVSYFK